ncbi:MAG: hypothetical protein KatS3mg057_0615 [Herpetosiphonaceae bacterium]|nr:MAG: hypothetical protein KatS3mg057_0615 [Herpetosiphonaceae bacterium]
MISRQDPWSEALLALRYLLTAQLFFLIWPALQWSAAGELVGFPYSPRLLALTHLFTLGWAMLTCLGVLSQLLPVLLQTPLRDRHLLDWGFWPMVAGIAIFCAGFYWSSSPVLIGGSALLTVGLLGALWSLGRTILAARRWSAPLCGIALSLLALLMVLIVGVLLVLSRRWGVLNSLGLYGLLGHAHLGLVGWFTVLTVSISYQLFPMFTLSHGYTCRWGALAVGGFSLVAYGSWIAIWAGANRAALMPLALIALFAGLLWLLDLRGILRHRVRQRIELAIQVGLGAALLLIGTSVWALLGLLGWPILAAGKHVQIEIMLGLYGWIGLMIVAMLHKILPFLIWLLRSNPSGGPAAVVARDLFNQPLMRVSVLAPLAGALVTILGVGSGSEGLVRAGAVLLEVAALGLLANSARALLVRPAAQRQQTGTREGATASRR